MKFVSPILLSVFASFANAESNMMLCATGVEDGKDLFPVKAAVELSEHWSIEYRLTSKVLNNTDAGKSYLLYQCGTPIPEDADQFDEVVQIPITSHGLEYTTFIPFIELLGKRTEIAAMGGQASWVYSPCLKQRISNDDVTMISSLSNSTLVELSEVDYASMPLFVGVGTSTLFSDFEISEWKETNTLAIFEWIKFFSVFFNLEDTANTIFDEAKNRVDCARENAAILATDSKPVVLWGSYSSYCNGWSVANSCPNYYCELADTCGAELLVSGEGTYNELCFANYLSTEEFVALGKDADVWIYPDGNVETILVEYADALKDFRSVKNNMVWDVAGQTMDAWFADRKTEPDTLIQDFCSVVGNENPTSLFPHQLTFLRHLDDAMGSPAVCVDETASLEKLGSQCTLIESVPSPTESPKEDTTKAPEDEHKDDKDDHSGHDHDDEDHDGEKPPADSPADDKDSGVGSLTASFIIAAMAVVIATLI